MLDQQQHVADRAAPAILDERTLKRQRVGVGHEAEPADFEVVYWGIVGWIYCVPRQACAGSQFSSACLTCDMNSSATAPSMMR